MNPNSLHPPYEGIRVYDATQGVAGPYATMLLAAHGADVVKVEPPSGDWGRILGGSIAQNCIHSLAVNRAKTSIAFDTKTPEGREISRRLLSTCDVVVESFRPGVAGRIGLSYDDVREVNPKVIYCSVSGFGQNGSNASRPTVDSLIQAYSGMMVMNKNIEGVPQRQGMVAVDTISGLYAFQAIAAALTRQIRFHEGAYIDANLMQSAAAFQVAKIMEFASTDGEPQPLYMPAGMLNTADGRIVISGMRQAHFVALCRVVGRPELAVAPEYSTQNLRSENGTKLMLEFRNEFLKRTTEEWLRALHAEGVMAEKVRDYGEWLTDPHVKTNRAYTEIEYPGFGTLPVANIPGTPNITDLPESAHVPLVGENSRDVMIQLGYADTEIDALVMKGILISHEPEQSLREAT